MKPSTSDQDDLVNQALEFLRAATSGDAKPASAMVEFGPTAEPQKDNVKDPAEGLKHDVLVERILSIVQKIAPVDIGSAIEPSNTEPTIGGSGPVVAAQEIPKKQVLVENTLTLVETVLFGQSIDAAPNNERPKSEPVHEIKFEDRLTFDRDAVRERVAKFKETQRRFQSEREEYYATTMAKVRATQWAKRSGMPNTKDR
jgi:hypothetical protein